MILSRSLALLQVSIYRINQFISVYSKRGSHCAYALGTGPSIDMYDEQLKKNVLRYDLIQDFCRNKSECMVANFNLISNH